MKTSLSIARGRGSTGFFGIPPSVGLEWMEIAVDDRHIRAQQYRIANYNSGLGHVVAYPDE